MARTRQNIEQLAELLDRGVDAESLGAEHAELANLVALASNVRENVALASPSEAFRSALRHELLTAPPAATVASAPLGAPERVRRFLEQRAPELVQSGRVVAATAAGAAVLATGGVVSVAQSALPGDFLYGLKGVTEDVRLSFANGLAETGRLHLLFAGERLEELEDGIDRLTSDLLADTLGDLDTEVFAAAEDLLAAFAETADEVLVTDLTAFTDNATERLTSLSSQLPAEVVPVLEDSLENLRRVEIQADKALNGEPAACEVCGTTTPIPPTTEQPPTITPVGEGPAVPVTECDCVAGPEPTPAPTPAPAPTPTEDPAPAPTETDEGNVPQLPGPIDPIGDMLDEQIDDLLEQLPVDPIDELPDEVQEPVEDLQDDINDTVGDVSDEIDDILP